MVSASICVAAPQSFEEFFAVFAGEGDGAGDVADELYDVSQVVLVPRVLLPRVRLKQVVSSSEFKGHAGTGPDVSWGTIASSKQDLQGAILARLDVLGEVVLLPASVAQVRNLHLQV